MSRIVFNQKRLLKTFFQLVKIDSPTGEEGKLADFLVNFLQKNQLVDFIIKDSWGNVYARKDSVGQSVFFSAHLDTVEPGKGVKPQIKGEYIVAEGETILGADNKSTIACILEVLRQIKIKQTKHRTLEIIFTLAEETDGAGATNFNYSLLQAKRGFCFDSSNPIGTIITAAPFYDRLDLVLTGKAAHPSHSEEAINALLLLNSLISTIELGRIGEDFLFNLGIIQSGTVRNTIPGEAVIKGEMRSLDEKKLKVQQQALIATLKEIDKKYGSTHQLEIIRENVGYRFYHSDPALQWIEKKVQIAGLQPSLKISWGVSDANIFNDKGLTCINLGDGTEFSHSQDERIKISAMENLVKLILSILTYKEEKTIVPS